MKQYEHPTAFSLWGEEEKTAIARVIESGRFTMGKQVEAFEEEFARAHSRRHGIMVNSGSSANLVAVAAIFNHPDRPVHGPRYAGETYVWENGGRGIGVGPQVTAPDQVIVPALAWSTTYAPLVQHGLDLILADVDETWNARIYAQHIATFPLVVIASILGNPCYGEQWKSLAEQTGALILEDNCESFWATASDGTRCGCYGTLSTFSFFHSHQISAIEGGMILTDDDELARLCRMLRAHGWTRDVERLGKALPFEKEYDFRVMGYNVRPLELHAAIAREQLKKANQFRRARMINAHAFHELAKKAELPIELPAWRGIPNPFGLHFLCQSPEDRLRLVVTLRANGIDCRLPTGGSFRRHQYGKNWRNQYTPVADTIHERGLFLGNAPFNIADKIERAVRVMADGLRKVPA